MHAQQTIMSMRDCRHLNNSTGHLLKKTAGNLLNCLASKGVATDHVKAFLSHMKDVTHLSYLEPFPPACILLAGHGPDWQHHHRCLLTLTASTCPYDAAVTCSGGYQSDPRPHAQNVVYLLVYKLHLATLSQSEYITVCHLLEETASFQGITPDLAI